MKPAVLGCAVVALACGADAFVGSLRPAVARRTSGVRMAADVTVPDLIKQTEQLKILSTASKLGLLSKLEQAGLTLRDVEKLLPLVDENDLIGLAQGAGPDLLKVAPAALAAAPAALPLVAAALSIKAEALTAAALASIAAGAGLVYLLPDDSLAGVALETFVAIPLLLVVPAVCAVGAVALGGLKSGALINLITSSSGDSVLSLAGSSLPAFPSDKSPSGRPMAMGKPAAQRKAAAQAKPKKAPRPKPVYKPAPKPKPMGNIANLPKAL